MRWWNVFCKPFIILLFARNICSCKAAGHSGGTIPTATTTASSPNLAVSIEDHQSPGKDIAAPGQNSLLRWKGIAAWTDSDAVTALTANCEAEPPAPAEEEIQSLSCKLFLEQSCSYHPCFTLDQDCQRTCVDVCEKCGDQCTQGCRECAKNCSDAPCRRACAETTGTCRDHCVKRRDSCATAACTKKEKACAAEENRKWAQGKCAGKCPAMQQCFDRCFEANPILTACAKKCSQRFGGCNVYYCILGEGAP